MIGITVWNGDFTCGSQFLTAKLPLDFTCGCDKTKSIDSVTYKTKSIDSVTYKTKSIDAVTYKKKSIERSRYYLSPSKVDLPDVPH
jgi:hypothetical protein